MHVILFLCLLFLFLFVILGIIVLMFFNHLLVQNFHSIDKTINNR